MEFLPAAEYKNLGTYETTSLLWQRFGEKTGVMVIGPAGEKFLTGASIQFADPAGRPARAAGQRRPGRDHGVKRSEGHNR